MVGEHRGLRGAGNIVGGFGWRKRDKCSQGWAVELDLGLGICLHVLPLAHGDRWYVS